LLGEQQEVAMCMRSIVMSGIAAAAVLTACSTAPPAGVYVKPGVSAEQLARDRAECAAAAVASDNRSVALPAAERRSVDACMRARGYSVSPDGGGAARDDNAARRPASSGY
jgi:hypothetical protein